MTTSSAAFVGHHWSPSDDDWDDVDDDLSRSKSEDHSSKISSPKSAPREALKWLTLNNMGEHTTSKARLEEVDAQTPGRSSSPPKKVTPDAEISKPSCPRRESTIPLNYIKTITEAFGRDADLYDDVLTVSRDSNPRELRISYFRRGREVLSEGETRKASEAATVGGSVSNTSKQRFQAVSMAYEILGNTAWREEYNEWGLPQLDEQIVKSAVRGRVGSPIIRRSSSMERPRSKGTNGVRWSEEVEELVFDQHPTEVPKSRAEARRSKKNRKPKKQIVVEGGHLERHLELLDKQAEKHFVFDFLDDIEASIDELISIGSLKKLRSSSKVIDDASKPATNATTEPKPATNATTEPKPPTNVTTEPRPVPTKKLTYDFEMPPDLITTVPKSLIGRTDTASTNDDTVSTLSYTISDRRTKKAPKTDFVQMESVVEEGGSLRSRDPSSTATPAMDVTPPERGKTPVANGCDEACDSDVWCGTDDDMYPKPRGVVNKVDGDVSMISRDDPAQTSEGKVDTGTSEFHIFLVTYLKSLAEDMCEWGASFQGFDFETTVNRAMQAMMITEGDLEGMMTILRTEIDRTLD